MVPMGPPSRPDKVSALIPRWSTNFDSHVRHPAVCLPLCQVFIYVGLDHTFTFDVGLSDRTEIILELLCAGFPELLSNLVYGGLVMRPLYCPR